MYPRQFFPRKDSTTLIDVNLVKKIVEQGDLRASYFVELQMNGEPLLHPKLSEIIDIVKSAGVTVGLSTNGTLIPYQLEALLKLDYITFSLDSVSNYKSIRIGKSFQFSFSQVADEIKQFLIMAEKRNIIVDIQVVKLNDNWDQEEEELKEYFKEFNVNIRSVPNCYLPYFFPKDYDLPVSNELCLNPWLSVSIACNGNVTPCCISPGDDIILGNLNTQTLWEVWHSREVEELRNDHTRKLYRPVCAKCYMRSPTLFHMDLFFKSIQKKY
jgi:radical SAM protein with 4Fe4S-binding SPASM domain